MQDWNDWNACIIYQHQEKVKFLHQNFFVESKRYCNIPKNENSNTFARASNNNNDETDEMDGRRSHHFQILVQLLFIIHRMYTCIPCMMISFMALLFINMYEHWTNFVYVSVDIAIPTDPAATISSRWCTQQCMC